MTPKAFAARLAKLGFHEVRDHSSKNYLWLELIDGNGRRRAIANIPTSKPSVSVGVLNRTLHRLGIRDAAHLEDLVKQPDPLAALLEVLPADAARWRPGGT